jgi:hypothetical protein
MGHSYAFAGLAWFLQQTGSGALAPEKTHSWLPTDLGTWGFILALAALLLAIPLGIAATLLAPKVRLWWFLRDVNGTASQLISLTKYGELLEKEPQFTLPETPASSCSFAPVIAEGTGKGRTSDSKVG